MVGIVALEREVFDRLTYTIIHSWSSYITSLRNDMASSVSDMCT